MSLGLGLFLLLLCVATEAFFSGSEIAMVQANRALLQAKADEGDTRAATALGLLEDESSLLGTCLIGTNFSTVTGASIATNLLLTQGISDGWIATAFFAPIVLVLGEALPKTIMQHHADQAVLHLAVPLARLRTLFTPFLAVVRAWNRFVSALTGSAPQEGYLTRQELLELLETHHEGPIDAEERRLIRGVLSLADLTVEACMTPLVQVVAVAEDATVGVAADIAVRTHHSRLPVYSRRIDNIVGMMHQADLLFLAEDAAPLAPHVRKVRFVPDVKSADALFTEMRTAGDHFAVVVDEYGGCIGIVTLEDLLEQFVGEIEDEHDLVRPTLIELEDGSWSVPGDTYLDEIDNRIGLSLPEGDYETIAGFVLHRLGRIPETGEHLDLPGAHLRVEQATDRAIKRVRIERTAPVEVDA